MSNEPNIPIKKISLLKRIKADWKGMFVTFSKAGVMYFAGKPESALKEVMDVVKAFEIKDTVEDLAYKLLRDSLLKATNNIIALSKESRSNL